MNDERKRVFLDAFLASYAVVTLVGFAALGAYLIGTGSPIYGIWLLVCVALATIIIQRTTKKGRKR